MNPPATFFPQEIFGQPTHQGQPPKVLVFPHRYIQGPGALDRLGHYLSVLPSLRPVVLISAGGQKRFGALLQHSLGGTGLDFTMEIFGGECAYPEIERLAARIAQQSHPADALIAVGGGKCLDTGKCVAYRLGVPVIICPTIASTDAPCSAVSVVYTPEGVQIAPEFFPSNPALVVVDTQIIINAPLRQLVSGMGDALATYYEARTCQENPAARSMIGGQLTMTALALARLCADTILEQGVAATEAVLAHEINDAFEKVVEANTLLSGVGFESGGLAAAHALASGLTVIPSLHQDFYHGELVGMGLVVQLLLEEKSQEARQVATFLAEVGLPLHAGQLGLDLEKDAGQIRSALESALDTPLIASEPFEVNLSQMVDRFTQAHNLGLEIARDVGDTAYRRLHP